MSQTKIRFNLIVIFVLCYATLSPYVQLNATSHEGNSRQERERGKGISPKDIHDILTVETRNIELLAFDWQPSKCDKREASSFG